MLRIKVWAMCFAPHCCTQLIYQPTPVGGQGAYPGVTLKRTIQIHKRVQHLLVAPNLRHVGQCGFVDVGLASDIRIAHVPQGLPRKILDRRGVLCAEKDWRPNVGLLPNLHWLPGPAGLPVLIRLPSLAERPCPAERLTAHHLLRLSKISLHSHTVYNVRFLLCTEKTLQLCKH